LLLSALRTRCVPFVWAECSVTADGLARSGGSSKSRRVRPSRGRDQALMNVPLRNS
jgi:hypothetical protein